MEMMSCREIKKEWVVKCLEEHSLKQSVLVDEEWYFKSILEAQNRCLKVVFNPLKNKVITVYFDRNMKKKGCK
jgi:hypothetical protein